MEQTVDTATCNPAGSAVTLIDCDVHNAPNSISDLLPFLSKRWQQYISDSGFDAPPGPTYPKAFARAARRDAWPPDGGLPGGNPDFARQQLLDSWGIDFAILNPLYNVAAVHNIDFAVALMQAVNNWTAEIWLSHDPRWRGSMVITPQDPAAAAAEIRRLGGDGRFVQVLLLVRSEALYGKRQFHPIFEAAGEIGVPIGIHFGGGGHPITPCGWPSYYLEDHTGMSLAFQAQVTSLVVEGVFETFPGARVTLIEGGFAWIPPLMWRLDKNYRALRDEVPWLTQPPSEYIRQHIRSTTQPIEEPPNPRHLMDIIDMIGCDDFLMFATDYPHWDFDAPDRAVPAVVSGDLRRRIMATNATDHYDFART
jgi:predicted TIM-barrel fold metal-dependent hydrolase